MKYIPDINKNLDIFIISFWILLFIANGDKISFMKTLFGIPLVLFIPGYVFLAALFPKINELKMIDRIILIFGLSIGVVSILGIITYTLKLSIFMILFTYIIALGIIVVYRRRNLSSIAKNKISINKLNKIKMTDTILIFSISLAIGMIFYVITVPKIGERFTEFYFNTTGLDNEDNYSINVGNNTIFQVGIVNHEYSLVNYTVKINLDKKVLAYQKLALDNNEKWEKEFSFIPDKKGTIKLEFLLFKENNYSTPYRELHLWVDAI